MKHLIILSAPPGSGKSTWAKAYIEEHPGTLVISSDEIRYELTGQLQDFSKQKEVWELFSKRIHDYAKLKDDVTVILDALCDLNWLRESYVKDNPEYDKYTLVLFPHTLNEIMKYNTQRDKERIVPDDVVKQLYDKFEQPTPEVLRLFDEVIEVKF